MPSLAWASEEMGLLRELAASEAEAVAGGAVAPLAAVLLVAAAAGVVFAVDLGYLVLVRSQPQRAADSATRAGAAMLAAAAPHGR